VPSSGIRRPTRELVFAAAIKAARVEAGRTQADVAEQADLPLRVVQQAEQGRRRIALSEAAAIAESLGRSLDDLVQIAKSTTFEPLKRGERGPRRADTP
jgi:transcriptional regulator with XRE-family HTH domain